MKSENNEEIINEIICEIIEWKYRNNNESENRNGVMKKMAEKAYQWNEKIWKWRGMQYG